MDYFILGLNNSDFALGIFRSFLKYTFHQNSIFYKSDALIGEDLQNIIKELNENEIYRFLREEDFHEKHNQLAIYSG